MKHKENSIFDSAHKILMNESGDGYIESMYADKEVDALVKVWKRWKDGPETESSDIAPARKELLDFIKRKLS